MFKKPSVEIQGFADLDSVIKIPLTPFDEFYNNGDLVFDLTAADVLSLTDRKFAGLFFWYYQNTAISLPMTEYLK